MGAVPWSLEEIDSQHPIVEVHYAGVLDAHELADAFAAAALQAQQRNLSRVLADCTELQGGHSVIDLYGLVSRLKALDPSGALHEALIRPTNKKGAELVRFFETAAVNRGLTIRTFGDRESAIDWLMQ